MRNKQTTQPTNRKLDAKTGANPWQILESTIVYQNPWITVREDKVIHPGGAKGIYGTIDAKDGILIIPEDADGNIYIMEAYRYPIKKWVWELCSGGIDEGDTPEECARKELQEELGLHADTIIKVGEFAPSYGGAMSDRQYVFVAQDLHEVETAHEDGEAIRDIKKISRKELFDMVRTGSLEDGQTLACLLHYKMWLEQIER